MLTKLTLSAQKDVVEKAKLLAVEQQTSVSALFSRFVRSTAAGTPGLTAWAGSRGRRQESSRYPRARRIARFWKTSYSRNTD